MEPFYPKPSIGQFSIEENEIILWHYLIKGMTTGEQQLVYRNASKW
jgi:UPF0176 protein